MCKRATLMTAALLTILAVFGLGCCLSISNQDLPDDTMIRAKNYSNGRFTNSEPTSVMKPGSYWDTTYQYLLKGSKERVPSQPLPVVEMKGFVQEQASGGIRFVWLGHSSVLVELGGKRVLFDPMFSERSWFVQWMGPKRFQPAPLRARDLPPLDAVFISHDHYDHLDKATIIELANKAMSFHVPLGVGAVLESWGIPRAKIHEYAWWEERVVNGITVAATPARHFSGRGFFDRNRTLWCSWTVIHAERKVYHSGDTGVTSQFREIGAKYGPFDLTFIKIGAYHENWPDIHLNPEQALEAHRDLRGRILVPIHWGTFDLALHSWYEPIERLVNAAEQEKARIITPKMGEIVDPDQYENGYWWRTLMSPGRKNDK